MRRGAALAATLTYLALPGCGATPPQAPLPDAKLLDRGTSGISTACGENYQLSAFPGENRREMETLEATAATSAGDLVTVYRRNRSWIYQGETVKKIVKDAESALESCALSDAAAILRRHI